MTVTVAFLARGIDAGIEPARAFLRSYHAHAAGHAHQLLLLAKGWDGIAGRADLDDLARSANARIIDLPDDGFDLGAYFRAAPLIDTEFLVLLNTHSRIIRDDWLGLLMRAAAEPGVGLVGCTGSWGSIGPSWRFWRHAVALRLRAGLCRDALTVLRAGMNEYVVLRYRTFRRFPAFPNPHIRSNAFLIRTADWRAFAAARRLPETKTDSHALESGRSGLTRYIHARRLRAVVMGADGVTRGFRSWREAETYFVPGQKNLLVSDNLTREYETAAPEKQRDLEALVWGRAFRAPASLAGACGTARI